jgi:hypothetical protein
MADNEKMWREENIDEDTSLPANAELRSMGITANGMSSDMSAIGGATTPPEPTTDDAGAAPVETPPAA